MVGRDTWIEDLVRGNPAAVDVLMNRGIRCIRCGEPIWGTLEQAALEKGLGAAELDAVIAEINGLSDQADADERDDPDDEDGTDRRDEIEGLDAPDCAYSPHRPDDRDEGNGPESPDHPDAPDAPGGSREGDNPSAQSRRG